MDAKIIRELQANGKITYKEIAQKLDVSDGMVRFRVDRLLKNNILKISASVNPMYFDNCVAALIGINLEKREHRVIMNKIATMKGVRSVCNLTGRYDLMVGVFLDSADILEMKLQDDSGILNNGPSLGAVFLPQELDDRLSASNCEKAIISVEVSGGEKPTRERETFYYQGSPMKTKAPQ